MENNNKPLVINLFGMPGSGKSTMMAKIFADLKRSQISCEMSPEYAKDKVWEENFSVLKNQVYIFGKQHHRLLRIADKNDVIITDSPLINSIAYDKFYCDEYGREANVPLANLVLYEFKKFNNINFFLTPLAGYDTEGRYQTESGARAVGAVIKGILDENDINYNEIQAGNDFQYTELIETVKGLHFTEA